MIKYTQELLHKIYIENNIPESHGIDHALIVLNHSINALKEIVLPEDKIINVKLASLLHDADDHKYFKSSSSNALYILDEIEKHFEIKLDKDEILRMIDLVSFSKNGNNIPEDINQYNEYILFPRYSDRLESIGEIGIKRCLLYSIETQRHIFTNNSPKYNNIEDIIKETSEERLQQYIKNNGNSVSTVDHFYDKLLHIGKFKTCNYYYVNIRDERMKPMIDFLLYYSKYGHVNKYLFRY